MGAGRQFGTTLAILQRCKMLVDKQLILALITVVEHKPLVKILACWFTLIYEYQGPYGVLLRPGYVYLLATIGGDIDLHGASGQLPNTR